VYKFSGKRFNKSPSKCQIVRHLSTLNPCQMFNCDLFVKRKQSLSTETCPCESKSSSLITLQRFGDSDLLHILSTLNPIILLEDKDKSTLKMTNEVMTEKKRLDESVCDSILQTLILDILHSNFRVFVASFNNSALIICFTWDYWSERTNHNS
jgi:hypothetical protein